MNSAHCFSPSSKDTRGRQPVKLATWRLSETRARISLPAGRTRAESTTMGILWPVTFMHLLANSPTVSDVPVPRLTSWPMAASQAPAQHAGNGVLDVSKIAPPG